MIDLRKFSQILCITLGIIITTWVIYLNFGAINLKKSNIPAEVLQNSKGIEIYKLDRDKYLRFPLLTQTDLIRIATNAEFSEKMDLRESSNAEGYVIEVQAYDIGGNLKETKILNFVSKTEFYFSEDWGMYLPSYFLTSEAIPSQTRINTLNYRDIGKIAELRVKRLDSNNRLNNIFVRVYQPTGVGDPQLDFYWRNLLPGEKERLAKANLYPVQMLKEDEKENLVKNLWSYVGAAGIPNEDYDAIKLYSVTNPHGIPYDLNLLHSGNYIDDNHDLAIPIDEDSTNLNLEVISADIIYPKYMKIWLGDESNNIRALLNSIKTNEQINQDKQKKFQFTEGQNIELTWRGRGLNQTINLKQSVPNRLLKKDYTFNSGLLVLSSNAPAYVNITKKTPSGPEPFNPDPASINLLRLDPEVPLDFGVFHSENSDVSFRIDLRRVSKVIFDDKMSISITYQLLGKDDKIIKTGELKASQGPTKLDFIVKRGNMYISDKDRYYLTFTPEVSKIRILGPKDIYVSVFNRLDDWQRHYFIPQDYKTAESKLESIRRTWFYKLPNDYEQIRLAQRTLPIKSQPRIIPENEDVKNSVYDWYSLLPEGNNWSATSILTKRIKAPARSSAEGAEYSTVPVNQEFDLEIIGYRGEENVAPSLMYSGAENSKITIFLNNNQYYQTILQSENGNLHLPNVRVGAYKAIIKADRPLKASINYCKNSEDNSFIKRNVVKINSKPLNFIFEKKSNLEQTITLRAYSTDLKTKKISVNIIGQDQPKNEAVTNYTIRNRDYQLSFNIDASVQNFIGNRKDALYGAEPMFIKMGEELLPGTYKINISSENEDGELYLALSSLTPGLVDDRSISTELQDE